MRNPVVLDASVAVDLVLGQNNGESLKPILDECSPVTAPDIYPSEVANALFKYVKAGQFSEQDALDRLDDALALIDSFSDSSKLITEALSESCKLSHPVYDMLYIVLTRRNAAALITRDKRLQKLAASQGIYFLYEMPEAGPDLTVLNA
jgi:predicted nucleic acid-binding protein